MLKERVACHTCTHSQGECCRAVLCGHLLGSQVSPTICSQGEIIKFLQFGICFFKPEILILSNIMLIYCYIKLLEQIALKLGMLANNLEIIILVVCACVSLCVCVFALGASCSQQEASSLASRFLPAPPTRWP